MNSNLDVLSHDAADLVNSSALYVVKTRIGKQQQALVPVGELTVGYDCVAATALSMHHSFIHSNKINQ